MTKILDGKKLAETIKHDITSEVAVMKERGVIPKLGVILVGNFPPSLIYVKNKENACRQVGIVTETVRLASDCDPEVVLKIIDDWNHDKNLHGILVQLPLPEHISTEEVLARINPQKDVDGLHPFNFGRIMAGEPYFYPCTPLGIVRLLLANEIEISGKHIVIIGRGELVGKPLANMLLRRDKDFGNATVTVCHTKTNNLANFTRQADILIVAIGSPEFLKKDMVKDGAVVVDVGVNRIEKDGVTKLVGDVDFENVKDVVSAITPVPGGVGPMTVAMLLFNTLKATKLASGEAIS
ncbi:MAG: bifunctional methylenetetrahydrofolate dehydrogenase/methenyltetrahydrofolate cyclohydrolase FolD [candidate division WOR-3 bacterium]